LALVEFAQFELTLFDTDNINQYQFNDLKAEALA